MDSYPNPYSALIATFNQVSPADSPSKDDLDDVQNFPDDDLLLWANAQFTFDIPPEGGAFEEDLGLKLGTNGLPGDQQQQSSPHSHDSQLQHHRQLLIQKQHQLLSLQLQQQQHLQQQQQRQQQQPGAQHQLQYRPQPPQQHSFHHVETADPRTLSVLERSRQRNPIHQMVPNPTASGAEPGFHVQTPQQQQQQLQQALHYHHSMIGLYSASDAAIADGQQAAGLLPLAHRGYPSSTSAGTTPNVPPTAARLARLPIPSPQGAHTTSSEAVATAASASAHEGAALSPKSETGNMSLAALQITTPPVSSQPPPPPPPSSSSLSSSLPVTTPIDEHAPHLASLEGESSDEDYDDFESGAGKDDQGSTSSASASSSLQRRSASLSKGSLAKDDPEYAVKLAAEEDKRRRNTAASARFRQKKRLREQALERTAKEMTAKSETLEARVKELEMEIKWLRGLIIEKDSRMLENMPPIKAIVAAAATSVGGGDNASESSNSNNKRGAPAAGGPSASANSQDAGTSGRKASSRRSKAV
ncbi:hypothetical protein DFQ26_008622 [Actinomortierella ambigua]|nr:hypothetical protein DFQ26_008622 [Actinomortierella ambigua]